MPGWLPNVSRARPQRPSEGGNLRERIYAILTLRFPSGAAQCTCRNDLCFPVGNENAQETRRSAPEPRSRHRAAMQLKQFPKRRTEQRFAIVALLSEIRHKFSDKCHAIVAISETAGFGFQRWRERLLRLHNRPLGEVGWPRRAQGRAGKVRHRPGRSTRVGARSPPRHGRPGRPASPGARPRRNTTPPPRGVANPAQLRMSRSASCFFSVLRAA